MNLFENPKYYNREDFDELDYDDQKELFLRIRSWVATVDNQTRYNKDKYKELIIKRIEKICAYACAGHVPSQDYMGYIYKVGFGEIFPVNYKRAIEWNIIAAVGGSKLAPQKMKTYMTPALDLIMLSPRWKQIIVYNELNLGNYYWFLSQYICEILYKELALNPVEMSKKELVEEDTNEKATKVFLDRFRNKSVNEALKILTDQLPENIPVEEGPSYGEAELAEEGASEENFDDINIDIDDI